MYQKWPNIDDVYQRILEKSFRFGSLNDHVSSLNDRVPKIKKIVKFG